VVQSHARYKVRFWLTHIFSQLQHKVELVSSAHNKPRLPVHCHFQGAAASHFPWWESLHRIYQVTHRLNSRKLLMKKWKRAVSRWNTRQAQHLFQFNFVTQRLRQYLLLFMAVVLNLGSIEPLGFDGAVSGVRRRSSETWLKAWLYRSKLTMGIFVATHFYFLLYWPKVGCGKRLENCVRVRRVCKG